MKPTRPTAVGCTDWLGIKLMIATTEMKWMGKNAKPARAGWHYTKNHDGSIAARYFDDSNASWWISTARNGWKPNDSFTEWLNIPKISDAQHAQ